MSSSSDESVEVITRRKQPRRHVKQVKPSRVSKRIAKIGIRTPNPSASRKRKRNTTPRRVTPKRKATIVASKKMKQIESEDSEESEESEVDSSESSSEKEEETTTNKNNKKKTISSSESDGDPWELPNCRGDKEEGDDGTAFFYGDSLTWGMAHNYTGRYEKPWPRLIEHILNSYGLRVVESALCSRTTVWDDPDENEWMAGNEPHYFNGLAHFAVEFISASPSWLVLLLGTNDLKTRIRASAKRTRADANFIAQNCSKIALLARKLHKNVLKKKVPLKIVMIAPPLVKINALAVQMGYDSSSLAISKGFPEAYHAVCEKHDFMSVDLKEIDMYYSVDGIHITEEANRIVAKKVLDVFLKDLINRPIKSPPVIKHRRPLPPAPSSSPDPQLILGRTRKRKPSQRVLEAAEAGGLSDTSSSSLEVDSSASSLTSVEDLQDVTNELRDVPTMKKEVLSSRMSPEEQYTYQRRLSAEEKVLSMFNLFNKTSPDKYSYVVRQLKAMQGKKAKTVKETLDSILLLLAPHPQLRETFSSFIPNWMKE